MLDWDDVRYFLAVEREGTVAGAARRLRVDATTVSRRIGALEETLRATLFTRHRDGFVLTEAGERVRDAALEAEGAMATVVREAAGDDAVPRGRVRLSTIEILATGRIAPHLPAFHAQHPDVLLDLIVTDTVLDIARGETDLAVRIGRPKEAALVARRLGTAAQRPYAHRSWLAARNLRASEVTALDGLDVLLLTVPGFRWTDGKGGFRAVLRTNSVTTLEAAVRAGLGIGLLPDVSAVRDPDLVPLPGLGVQSDATLWVVMHKDLADVARVRVVVEFLEERFADPLFHQVT